jgi:Brf1-like TBP-binding domain
MTPHVALLAVMLHSAVCKPCSLCIDVLRHSTVGVVHVQRLQYCAHSVSAMSTLRQQSFAHRALCRRDWLDKQAAKRVADEAARAAAADASAAAARRKPRIRFAAGETAEASVLNMFEAKSLGPKVNRNVIRQVFECVPDNTSVWLHLLVLHATPHDEMQCRSALHIALPYLLPYCSHD